MIILNPVAMRYYFTIILAVRNNSNILISRRIPNSFELHIFINMISDIRFNEGADQLQYY